MNGFITCSGCGQRNSIIHKELQDKCEICRKLGKRDCGFYSNSRPVGKSVHNNSAVKRKDLKQVRVASGRRQSLESVLSTGNLIKRSSSIGQRSCLVFVPVEQRIVYLTPVIVTNR
jgi:hypothetical protein